MNVLICTSHRPSPRTRTFCRDLVASSAIFQYHVRGKWNIVSLIGYARVSGAQRVWIVDSRHGNPNLLTFYDVSTTSTTKIGSMLMKRVVLRRDMPNLYPKPTRTRPISLVPPVDEDLKDLYHLMKRALPNNQLIKGPCTELRIERPSEKKIELLFVESETGSPCGPKITVGDYRC